MRTYDKVIRHRNFKWRTLNRGLKKVNIGDDVWLVGRQTHVPGKGLHCVIYGPDRKKEYHVWGRDVEELCTESNGEIWGGHEFANVNRHGNRALQSKVKIYILTSILDDRKNWSFDLKNHSMSDGKLKVIYDNGTVKNIDFDGEFKPVKLLTWTSEITGKVFDSNKIVKPVAYRRWTPSSK